jgi:hypothetical protein
MDHAPGIPPQPDVESTGIEAVDRVLAEVAAVANAPVAEHVQVFERAHEQLRRALDAAPDASAHDSSGPADDRGQGA